MVAGFSHKKPIRNRAKEALSLSEEKFSKAFRFSPNAVTLTRLNDGKIIEANESVFNILGFTPKEAIGRSTLELNVWANPEDRVSFANELSSKGFVRNKDYIFRRKDGTKVIVTLSASTIMIQNENCLLSSFIDITEQKKAEEALRESEHRCSWLYKAVSGGVVVQNLEGSIIEANDAACEMLGLTRDQIIGRTSTDKRWHAIHEDGSPFSGETHPAIITLKTGEAIRNVVMGVFHPKENKYRWIVINSEPMLDLKNNLQAVTTTFLDITEQKQAEKKLKESKEKYQAIIEAANDFIWETDTKARFTYCSPQLEKLWGIKPQHIIGKTFTDLFKQELSDSEKGKIYSLYLKLNTEPKPFSGLEVPSYNIKGQLFFTEINAVPFFDANNKLLGWRGITRDITDRKKAEEKLAEYTQNLERLVEERTKKIQLSASYARNLIETSLDPLVTISAEGKITDVNKATELVTGYSREELIGSDFSLYFTDPEKASLGYKQAFVKGLVIDYPLAIKHKSGKITYVLYNATVYRNADGKISGIFAAARDITERKKLEKQLQNAERLAAIGATAGMVGHDIRNPLQAITGDLYLVKTELTDLPNSKQKENIYESIKAIEQSVEYINKIVQDLQYYAKPITPVQKLTNIKELINLIISKIGLSPNIEVRIEIQKEASIIVTDPDLFRRIISNLISNSIQAMPNGGELDITAWMDEKDIVITTSDTGVGIPDEVKPKLFTPMVTTKAKGQGFGLAAVKRITEALGGSVSFESEVGKRTKFIIRLPQKT